MSYKILDDAVDNMILAQDDRYDDLREGSDDMCDEWLEGRKAGRAECAAGPWQPVETAPIDESIIVRTSEGRVCFATYKIDDEGQDYWSFWQHINEKIIAWARINTQEED